MKKGFWIISILILSLGMTGNVRSQALDPGPEDHDLTIMRPDAETRLKWIEEYEKAPQAVIDSEVELRIKRAQVMGAGTSLSLLDHLQYIPNERNQGKCGNCWNWTGTGMMEIALSGQSGIKDRLSTQFLNSCYMADRKNACCGGTLGQFVNWYASEGFSVPWANTNAFFQDANLHYTCDPGNWASSVSCSNISTFPNYPIASIQAETIQTHGVGQSTAIANIKNILNQGRGVWLDFWLATEEDWNAFYDFWDEQPESALWDSDSSCGQTWEDAGGGHAILIAGYNDEDPNAANHYWIALNSWGTAGGGRPNGLFRIPMTMNYGCTYSEGAPVKRNYYSRNFMTLGVEFNVSSTGNKPNLTPYQPVGWSDKVVVSKATGRSVESPTLSETDTLYVDWAVINDSMVSISTPFTVALYLDGAFLSPWNVGSLNAGRYIFATGYPIGSLSPGNHTIKIVADSTGVIEESKEGDNAYEKTITVVENRSGPDLTGSWISARQSSLRAIGGQTGKIIGSFRMTNIGNRDASSCDVEFYLSNGGNHDVGDLLLKKAAVGPIRVGKSKAIRLNINLPFGEHASGKYIIAVIDPDHVVSEKDEGNNSVPFGPLP
jgi:hypothetical protein